MARFRVVIEKRAEAEFLAIPFPFRRRLNQLLFKLIENPRLPTSELIEEGSFRIRAHGWVVLYEVDDERASITVLGFRKDVPPS